MAGCYLAYFHQRQNRMLTQEWQAYNHDILESIKNEKLIVGIDKKILDFVANYEKFVLNDDILGELGYKLSELFRHSDKNHPEFSSFVKTLLGDDCIKEVTNLISTAKFLSKKKFFEFLPKLKFLASNFKKENFILNGRSLNDPFITNIHIRFLDRHSMWSCRNIKKRQIISNWKNKKLNSSENLNYEVFSCYHHNSNKTNILKKELEKRRKSLMQLNCVQMVQEIDEALQKLSQESLDKNYGFRRITLSNVANAYRDYYETEDDIIIVPVSKEIYDQNVTLQEFVDTCDNYGIFNNYPLFDHYGLVGSTKIKSFILVAERDTQTFFLGYAYHG